MDWGDVKTVAAAVTVMVTVIPFALTAIAARAGYKQVREFHAHTGDNSLLTSITAFSRFHEGVQETAAVAAKVVQEEPEHVG